ncbi:hypothetical protein [uncultured Sphingomonas sp.]|uniref:hypothetical protein n=1 Tax=uncultured Sphingomonas sp. TaxID=158754 RepID=UPI0035CC755E
MFRNDRDYFQYRAEIEVQRAQEATVSRVAQVHHQFAEAYLGKLASSAPTRTEIT